MNKKKIIITLIILVALILAYIIYNQATRTIMPQAPTPPADISPQGQGGVLREDGVYELPEGNVNIGEVPESVEKLSVNSVIVNNFFRGSYTHETSNDVAIGATDDFGISYLSNYNVFKIIIIGSPFEEKRNEAENEFIEKLGISKEQACKLNVDIATTVWANPEESGTNYKLSWCN